MTVCRTAQVWAIRIGLCGILASAGLPAGAADFSDPDWPCVQRKVPEMAPSQVWSGPALPTETIRDADIEALASRLAIRRTGLDEVDTLVAGFSDAAGADRGARLAALFAATFVKLNAERGDIVQGIARYAHRQSDLTKKIETLRDEQQALIATPNPTNDQLDRIELLEDEIIWNTRIFNDRQQALTYVCETPVIIEQRAFSIAKTIQARLN